MRTIAKKEDLNKPLEKNDRVVFYYKGIILEYTVADSFLALERYGRNEKIFKLLNLSTYDFAKQHYGYTPGAGDWPTCKSEDYIALTRIVEALFDEIEKQETEKPFKSLKETHDEYEKTNKKERTAIKKIQFIKHLKIKGD